VKASKTYLTHIVSNLLENAEKYTSPDEPIEVEVAGDDGEAAVVRVLDRGIGLTVEEKEHIFEPFYRSARISGVAAGVGIGLSVCKRLVEEQGGRIWAASRAAGGSEFGFTVPFDEREDNG
jgi:signal transduction histidine kinase